MQSNRLVQAPHKGLNKLRGDVCWGLQHHCPKQLELMSTEPAMAAHPAHQAVPLLCPLGRGYGGQSVQRKQRQGAKVWRPCALRLIPGRQWRLAAHHWRAGNRPHQILQRACSGMWGWRTSCCAGCDKKACRPDCSLRPGQRLSAPQRVPITDPQRTEGGCSP